MKHPFAELIGLEFESVHAGRSVCRLETNAKHLNPHGVVHGAVMHALADTGMGGALYPQLQKDRSCATIEIKISYFKPVKEGVLECSTQLVSKGRAVAFLESEIYCGNQLVAKASGSYAIFVPRQHVKIKI
jgi:acyl-CoA thioesterase